MQKQQIQLYDTTLRDGTQAEGISLSVDDKLKVTRLLDELGVHTIEGGWPGSNPKDAAYFERVRSLNLKQAKIAAFGSTCRVGSQPADDANIRALLDAGTPVVTVVGKSWMLHVTEVLRATPEENLRIIRESVAYLIAQGKEVVYDAEHFFDGYKVDPTYTLSTLQAAVDGGATLLVLCDTNGGLMPWEIAAIVGEVKTHFPDVALGIHTRTTTAAWPTRIR
jgi:2-isopropylmalate synthase